MNKIGLKFDVSTQVFPIIGSQSFENKWMLIDKNLGYLNYDIPKLLTYLVSDFKHTDQHLCRMFRNPI